MDLIKKVQNHAYNNLHKTLRRKLNKRDVRLVLRGPISKRPSQKGI